MMGCISDGLDGLFKRRLSLSTFLQLSTTKFDPRSPGKDGCRSAIKPDQNRVFAFCAAQCLSRGIFIFLIKIERYIIQSHDQFLQILSRCPRYRFPSYSYGRISHILDCLTLPFFIYTFFPHFKIFNSIYSCNCKLLSHPIGLAAHEVPTGAHILLLIEYQ